LQALLASLSRWLTAPASEVLDAVRNRDALRDRPVRWAAGAGTAAGIDDEGRLLVRTAAGAEIALDAGEVHLQPNC
jgi:BirA family biotin operon repressor/biotin-[acetyl-CoA-carboxylase] ligase